MRNRPDNNSKRFTKHTYIHVHIYTHISFSLHWTFFPSIYALSIRLDSVSSVQHCASNIFYGSHALFTRTTNLFFNKTFIKNGSYGTIHTFKNYFATLFSIFSNKRYPNRLLVCVILETDIFNLSFIYHDSQERDNIIIKNFLTNTYI